MPAVMVPLVLSKDLPVAINVPEVRLIGALTSTAPAEVEPEINAEPPPKVRFRLTTVPGLLSKIWLLMITSPEPRSDNA